jgi:DNA-binding transcriptional regulator YiaG
MTAAKIRSETKSEYLALRYLSLDQTWPNTKQLSVESPARTVVQDLIEQVRANSGLTLEEISPLLGVSRRSLQHWLSGRHISARNEQRLRALADTLSSLPTADPSTSRHRQLHESPTEFGHMICLLRASLAAADHHSPSAQPRRPLPNFTHKISLAGKQRHLPLHRSSGRTHAFSAAT